MSCFLGQVWCLIVLIPDLCRLSFIINIFFASGNSCHADHLCKQLGHRSGLTKYIDQEKSINIHNFRTLNGGD